MMKDLTPAQAALADLMSEISERCYYAGWIQDLEYVLWDAVQKGERKYGHDRISNDDIEALKTLSEKAGVWIVYDDLTEETAIDISSWQKKFQTDVESNPELLKG